MLSWIALTLAAGSADLWSYGCDHFLYGACLRCRRHVRDLRGTCRLWSAPRQARRRKLPDLRGAMPRKACARKHAGSALYGRRICRVGYARAEGRSTRYDVYVRPGSSGAGSLHIRGSATTADDSPAGRRRRGFRICNFQQSKTLTDIDLSRRAEWGSDCRSGSCVPQRAASRINHQAPASRSEASQRRNTAVSTAAYGAALRAAENATMQGFPRRAPT